MAPHNHESEWKTRGLSASAANWNGFRCPFLYSTNGEVIWFHGVRHQHSRSRPVAAFHTSKALR